MNADPRDRYPTPVSYAPSGKKGGAFMRFILAVFVVGLLALGVYEGALWLRAHRDTLLRAPTATTTAAAPEDAQPPAAPAASGVIGALPAGASGAAPGEEPPAPAVLGNAADIHPCVLNGQTTYTSQPCPSGAQPLFPPRSAADANGVVGSTGEPPAAAPGSASPTPADDGAAARDAECGYLAAEIARLRHEFDQPLPPPVLDQVASRLKALRARSAQRQCPAEPTAAAAAAAASAPARPRPRASRPAN